MIRVFFLTLWSVCIASPHVLAAKFYPLNIADYPSAVAQTCGTCLGVSGNGRVIYYITPVKDTRQALYLWTPKTQVWKQVTTPMTLNEPMQIAAVNDNATLFVGRYGHNAYVWNVTNFARKLNVPEALQKNKVKALGISQTNSVIIGSVTDGTRQQAVMWRKGQFSDLSQPQEANSSVVAVSANGSVVVGNSINAKGETKGFRWTQTKGIEALPPTTQTNLRVVNLSADGQTTLLQSDAPYVLNRFNQYIPLDTTTLSANKPDTFKGALHFSGAALTLHGRVVVGAVTYTAETITGSAAVIWVDGKGYFLSDYLANKGLTFEGWHFNSILSISDNGKVLVGEGINPEGKLQAWALFL